MKKRFLSIAAFAMACAMAVTGCSSGSTESTAEGETAEGAAEGGALDDNVLTVAMECGYAPYNWTQPTDANGAVQIKDSPDYAYGYDVMMAKHIAEELGMELEIVKLDWDSLVPAVQSGTVDCVIAGQSITSERKEMVDFTEPYYYASIVTLILQELHVHHSRTQSGTMYVFLRSPMQTFFPLRNQHPLCSLPLTQENATSL